MFRNAPSYISEVWKLGEKYHIAESIYSKNPLAIMTGGFIVVFT